MLDIAPFGYRIEIAQPRGIELRWEEPRDLVKVVLHFPDSGTPSDPGTVRVLYWRRLWPQERRETTDPDETWAGWRPIDDWYHGDWQPADVEAAVEGGRLAFSFRSLADREFPDLTDYRVAFRRTMKLRVELPENGPAPSRLQALVEVALAETEVCLLWEAAAAGEGRLEAYNCHVTGLRPLAGAEVGILGTHSWVVEREGVRRGLRVGLQYAADRGEDHPDRSILTVCAPGRGFSFRVDPVARGEVMHVPDLGVRIWPASLGEAAPKTRTGGQSIYDRVSALPEQSFRRAMDSFPPRKPFYFVLACEGGRQKFRLEPDGDLLCPPNFVTRVPGKDTPRLKGEGAAGYRFGLGEWERTSRGLDDGHLPVISTTWRKGALAIEQTAFAAPATSSLLADAMEGDEPVAAFLRFRFVNGSDGVLAAELPIHAVRLVDGGENPEQLSLKGDSVFARGPSPTELWLRMIVSAAGGAVAEAGDGLSFRADLPARGSAELTLKIPFLVLGQAEAAVLRGKDWLTERAHVQQFWRQRVGEGCQIITPEPDINDFYRAHLTHMLMTNDREPGSDRIIPRVGSFAYGNYGNESCMCISELDRRGYREVAERCLDTFLHYQGTAGLSGDFSSQAGQFYGSGGYESGQYYVQHHGWVLWGLAQHYHYTRDADWLRRAAPHIISGCDWVISERRAAMAGQGEGGGSPAYGMLPVGGLEDVGEWYHWLSNDVFSWWGVHWAAGALAAVGHPEAARLTMEAAAYRQDILAAFHEASRRSPLVRLRDGSYLPHLPSRLYLRGRDSGWIRETLEGAIHLVCTGLLDPQSAEATWIIKDYEDNRYLSREYGYALEDEERWWFDHGGFSKQPNLLWGPIAYLMRDDVAHYLRAYFNSLAAAFRADTRMCTEHPLPSFADWAGDHFKTSDESQSAHWLRLMFVREVGDELWLGQALPRAWLAHGCRVAIRQAMTHFGRVSLEMVSSVADGYITVHLDPPRRNPPSLLRLRLRHPHGAGVRSVEADGTPACCEIRDDWVALPPPAGPVTLIARF